MGVQLAIHGKSFSAETKPLMEKMWADICAKNCQPILSDFFKNHLLEHGFSVAEVPSYSTEKGLESADMAWSIGGDGTLLETLTHIGAKELPILGLNTGRLGFLATLSPQDVSPALDQLIQ